ncbi:MAG: protein kinase [Myxococcales bacterium]|nr:protein kinase [Myxococcales bacterium]
MCKSIANNPSALASPRPCPPSPTWLFSRVPGCREPLEPEVELIDSRELLEAHSEPRELLEPHSEPRTPPSPIIDIPHEGAEALLDGRYRLLRLIEAGGHGVVHEAWDVREDRRVAIKTMHRSSVSAEYRLRREFRVVKHINHPNLVRLYSLGFDRRRSKSYYTMEIVDGVDFRAYVREGAPPERLSRLRAALRQLTAAVLALHKNNRIHRDLKPSNVLVNGEGRLVVLDFGLTDALDRDPVTLRTVGIEGTPHYMSPEQATGSHTITPASDWYTVGVMIYEALVGVPPIPGASFWEICARKHELDPTPMSERVPGVPRELDALVTRLLDRDPTRRPGAPALLSWCSQDRSAIVDIHPSDASSELERAALVGREDAIERFSLAVDRLLMKLPTTVLLSGQPGTGKSALMQHVLQQFRARVTDGIVLSSRCHEHESVPFRAFDRVVEDLARFLLGLPDAERRAIARTGTPALVRLFGVLSRVNALARSSSSSPRGEPPDQQELQRAAFSEFKTLLHAIATRYSVVLALDDIHHGDADSARLLDELIEQPGPPQVLIIASFRSGSEARSPMLRDLRGLRASAQVESTWRIELAPLEDEAAETLAASRLRRAGLELPGLAGAVARESGGNALLIEQLVGFIARDPVALSDRYARLGARAARLEQVLAERFSTIDADARRFVEFAAIAAAPTRLDDLTEAMGYRQNPHSLLARLQSAQLLQISNPDPKTVVVECINSRIREAILELIEPAQRAELHRVLAETLIARQRGDAEVWAHHFLAANCLHEVAEHAAQAAYEAREAMAFAHAVDLFELAHRSAPESLEIRVKLADTLALAGRCARAGDMYFESARASRRGRRMKLLCKAAEHLLSSAEGSRHGLKVLEALLSTQGVAFPDDAREARRLWRQALYRLCDHSLEFREHNQWQLGSRLLLEIDTCWIGGKGLLHVDPVRGGYLLAQSTLMALFAGEPRRVARGLAMVGMLVYPDDPAAGLRLLSRAEGLAERIGDQYATGLVMICRGAAYRAVGQWLSALLDLEDGLDHLRANVAGIGWETSLALSETVHTLAALGEFSMTRSRLLDLRRFALATGFAHATYAVSAFAGLMALADDDLERAEALVFAGLPTESSIAMDPVQHFVVQLSVHCDLYRGLATTARERVAHYESRAPQARDLDTNDGGWALARARVALATAGEGLEGRDALYSAVHTAIAALESRDSDANRACVALLRAALANLEGKSEETLRSLRDAEDLYILAGAPVLLACTKRRLGRLLGGDQGLSQITAADRLFADEGVSSAERWTLMLAPGLSPEESGRLGGFFRE